MFSLIRILFVLIFCISALPICFSKIVQAEVLNKDDVVKKIMTELKNSGVADFSKMCADDKSDSCRTISSRLFSDIMRNEDSTFNGAIRISNVIITGENDLRWLSFKHAIIVEDSIIEGLWNMEGADFDKDLTFINVKFRNGILGDGTNVGGLLEFKNTNIVGKVFDLDNAKLSGGLVVQDTYVKPKFSLIEATVTGIVKILHSNCDGGLDGWLTHIDGSLIIGLQARFGDTLNLLRAKIDGHIHLDETHVVNGLNAEGIQLDGSFISDNNVVFDGKIDLGGVDLEGAKVGGDIIMYSTTINSALCSSDQKKSDSFNGQRISVNGTIFIDNNSVFKCSFDLLESSIIGNVEIGRATFFHKFDLGLSDVKRSVFVHDATFTADAYFEGANIGGHLDVTGSSFSNLLLGRSNIQGDFRIASRKPTRSVAWTDSSLLSLRHAHVGVIQDELNAESDANADPIWPKKIDLQGFTFDRFGNKRNADWAEKWLAESNVGTSTKRTFDPQPYEQMASYFKNVGQLENSDAVRSTVRDLEREYYKESCVRRDIVYVDPRACWHFGQLTFFKYFIGYGIGYGLCSVFIPVILLVLAGYLVIKRSPGGREKAPLWCVGASLNKLVPIANFNKEFVDAFEVPEILQLSNAQKAYFTFHALIGFILASFVLAALAGLTQAR